MPTELFVSARGSTWREPWVDIRGGVANHAGGYFCTDRGIPVGPKTEQSVVLTAPQSSLARLPVSDTMSGLENVSVFVARGKGVRVGYFDCFSGTAGDMTLAALVDAGVDRRAIQQGVASLGLPCEITFENVPPRRLPGDVRQGCRARGARPPALASHRGTDR